MLRTFNCGLGGVLIVEKGAEDEILRLLSADGATIIGKVTERIAGNILFIILLFDCCVYCMNYKIHSNF